MRTLTAGNNLKGDRRNANGLKRTGFHCLLVGTELLFR